MPVGHLYAYVSFAEMSLRCPFFRWIFVVVEWPEFCILDLDPLSGRWFANIASHPVSYLCALLIVSFAAWKFLS